MMTTQQYCHSYNSQSCTNH